jgi:Cft2 family RNA processing exonuclease
MLQRLLDIKPKIACESVHAAITDILQQLLITGYPAVELVDKPGMRVGAEDPQIIFDRVRIILHESSVLDADAPVSETAAGVRRLRVANPYYGVRELRPRIRINEFREPAAALLHAFILLRIRYQQTGSSDSPIVRVEASPQDQSGLDLLYLIGDAFTERYPVTAELATKENKVILTLVGEPALISGGLNWPRADYVRARDVSLLVRPLRQAIDGVQTPLAIPREVRGPLGHIRIRIPEGNRHRIKGVHWLSSLDELGKSIPTEPIGAAGLFGEHLSVHPTRGGYIAAQGDQGTEVIFPVRCIASTTTPEVIVPEASDGTIAVAFEALGGAREIGANCYYYTFGDRGLIVDLGFDATRDGWLGLPALERVSRLDAIILTHAHLDHIGALPTALAAFPNVPVYCTRATKAVLFPQLYDSAKVAKLRRDETGEGAAVSHGLVESIAVERFRIVSYGIPTEVPEVPGLTLKFQDAGHIIGSACARLEFGGMSIVHTGDISVEDQHLLHGMEVGDLVADHLVMEGTYCGEPDFTREHRRKAVHGFLAAVEKCIEAGGSVLVPAFSLGRAQELVGMLVDWNEHNGRSVPIWTVGLVNALNDVSSSLPEFLPGLSGTPFKKVRSFPQVRADSVQQRRDEYARHFFTIAEQAPSIIIASHGMMTENTGSYLIGRAILTGGDPRHAIFLCGYMDPRTPGFRLRHQCEEPVIDYGMKDAITRTIPKDRIQFHRLTAHASYEELIDVAFRMPVSTVTFIHGDGEGLDKLKVDVLERFSHAGRAVKVRAPAIGERFLIQRVSPPVHWDEATFASSAAYVESIGPGRMFDRPTGFAVRGLTVDRRWALIPIGRRVAIVTLEHDRIERGRIERIEIRPRIGGPPVVAFDRASNVGNIDEIEWSVPGEVALLVSARDPNGQLVKANFSIFYGAEIRALRTALSAASPVIEVEIGGELTPEFMDAKYGDGSKKLDVQAVEWDAISRMLRLRLSAVVVGNIENVNFSLRWPNGFIQRGPSVGDFSAEPIINFLPAFVKVGIGTSITVASTPAPDAARVGGKIAILESNEVKFTAKRPGPTEIEFEYGRLSDGGQDSEWREVAILDVQPSASVELPATTQTSRGLRVVVLKVESAFYGLTVTLRIGETIRDTWIANESPRIWSGSIDDTDPLDVAVLVQEFDLVLWAGTVRVYAGIELDRDKSLTVTTADGTQEAELIWIALDERNRAVIENAFKNSGFSVNGWDGDTLRVGGTENTRGSRDVLIADGDHVITVRLMTLPDLHLRLRPSGPIELGKGVTACFAAGEIAEGLRDVDGGPLVLEVDRISPLLDALSVRIAGNRIHFLHPGHYKIALVASDRRLVELEADVRSAPKPTILESPKRREMRSSNPYEASLQVSEFLPFARTVVLSTSHEYRVLQDSPTITDEAIWDFMSERLDDGEKVLVSWPGLALGETAGYLLRRLRIERPNTLVGHLSYPAPRGEIAADEAVARRLFSHRVLCAARGNSTIDRLDSYSCPSCGARPLLQTDNSRIWLRCLDCGYCDLDLVLTLVGLRSTDVQVLFADFRIAKYLTRGFGSRYAGSFGRSVRCQNCHGLQPAFSGPGPWDKAELYRLVSALISVWDSSNQTQSIRRAVRYASKRVPRSRPSDIPRLENALSRLIDAKVIVDGRVVGQLERLEAGLSLCCNKPLFWSSSRSSYVFLDIEELLSPDYAGFMHPELSTGQAGIRQFLSLSE